MGNDLTRDRVVLPVALAAAALVLVVAALCAWACWWRRRHRRACFRAPEVAVATGDPVLAEYARVCAGLERAWRAEAGAVGPAASGEDVLFLLRRAGFGDDLAGGLGLLWRERDRLLARHEPRLLEGVYCLGGSGPAPSGLCVCGLRAAAALSDEDAARLLRVGLLDAPSGLPNAARFAEGSGERTDVSDAPARPGDACHPPEVAAALVAAAKGVARALEATPADRGVLVHCHMGFSRSVAVVLCALMLVVQRGQVAAKKPRLDARELFRTAAAQFARMRRARDHARAPEIGKFTNVGTRQIPFLLAFARTLAAQDLGP